MMANNTVTGGKIAPKIPAHGGTNEC
jgi:hypothetical protein